MSTTHRPPGKKLRQGPPEQQQWLDHNGENYYQDIEESKRYSSCAQTNQIQRELALECTRVLLEASTSCHTVLNVGCGSGMCGRVLSRENVAWIGADVSRPMLERSGQGDMVLEADCFERLPFRDLAFDAAISISAIQWICVRPHPDTSAKLFFGELRRVLREPGVFVAQLYPRNQQDLDMLWESARACGFQGGTYTTFPHASKAKKKFMFLVKKSSGLATNGKRWPLSGGGVCPLSWPFQTRCGGAAPDRLEAEHFGYSSNSIRLLRRAFRPSPETQDMSSCHDVHQMSSRTLAPCGGCFSLHVWHDQDGCKLDINQTIGWIFGINNTLQMTSRRVHEKKAGVRVHWWTDTEEDERPEYRESSQYFSLRRVLRGDNYEVRILESPKRPPLGAVFFPMSSPANARSKLAACLRNHPNSSIIGVDVSGRDAAVLLYFPSTGADFDSIMRSLFI
jgi:18S rRNA (guanine1575-N7)-methyltransferase